MAKVIVADICGLCYGSNRAVEGAKQATKNNSNVVLFKEILHNKNVMKILKENGATVKENLADIEPNDYVVVRAHGEKKDVFKYFDENGINYLDCTCPNVKRVTDEIDKKNSEGYKIIILGKHGFDGKPMHPEVEAAIGWCDDPILIEDESEISGIDLSYDKYFLVVQTTFSMKKAEDFICKISKLMKEAGKEFDYSNTICSAQKIINKSAEKLAREVTVMIVLGGKNSSNTKELYNNMSNRVKSYLVENLDEAKELVDNGLITSSDIIGITAGASTPKEDILQLKNFFENLKEK